MPSDECMNSKRETRKVLNPNSKENLVSQRVWNPFISDNRSDEMTERRDTTNPTESFSYSTIIYPGFIPEDEPGSGGEKENLQPQPQEVQSPDFSMSQNNDRNYILPYRLPLGFTVRDIYNDSHAMLRHDVEIGQKLALQNLNPLSYEFGRLDLTPMSNVIGDLTRNKSRTRVDAIDVQSHNHGVWTIGPNYNLRFNWISPEIKEHITSSLSLIEDIRDVPGHRRPIYVLKHGGQWEDSNCQTVTSDEFYRSLCDFRPINNENEEGVETPNSYGQDETGGTSDLDETEYIDVVGLSEDE